MKHRETTSRRDGRSRKTLPNPSLRRRCRAEAPEVEGISPPLPRDGTDRTTTEDPSGRSHPKRLTLSENPLGDTPEDVAGVTASGAWSPE